MLLHVSGTVVAPHSLMQGSSPFTVIKNIFRDNSNERLIGQISRYKIQTTGNTNTFLRCSQLTNIYEFIIHFHNYLLLSPRINSLHSVSVGKFERFRDCLLTNCHCRHSTDEYFNTWLIEAFLESLEVARKFETYCISILLIFVWECS